MMTCKQVAELVSQALETPLSRWQRFALGVHLSLCGPCGRFRRQSLLVQRAGRLLGQDHRGAALGAALSEAARERIKRSLQLQGPGGPA